MSKHTRQSGFTLVELMVGLVIGLLVMAIIIVTFAQSKRSYSQDEKFARLQESGRFVLATLTRELSMAGFLGNMQINDTITNSYTGDACSEAIGWSDTSTPMTIYQSSDTGISSCFGAGETPTAGTRILVVKHTDGKNAEAITTSLTENRVFFVTNGRGGSFSIATPNTAQTAMASDPNTQYWQYETTMYYVRDDADGVPTLYRKYLAKNTSAPAMSAEEALVPGLVRVGVIFGLDKYGYNNLNQFTNDTRDGVADTYTTDTSDLTEVVSAKLDVLVRSEKQDFDYTNDKSYYVGATTITSLSGTNYYGKVFSTSVHLRNIAYRLQMENI